MGAPYIYDISRLRVNLHEKGCIYKYGIVCFTCIGINSLVGRRACSTEHSVSKHV